MGGFDGLWVVWMVVGDLDSLWVVLMVRGWLGWFLGSFEFYSERIHSMTSNPNTLLFIIK